MAGRRHPYVFFLHDDTEVEPSTIARLADVLDANADAAAVCPLLVDAQGHPLRNSAISLPTATGARLTRRRRPVPRRISSRRCLMMRVGLIRAIRQIDERYGQFGSDADLAAQIRKASKKLLLVPAAASATPARLVTLPPNMPIS